MSTFLDDRDVEKKGSHLEGKTIGLVISGGVAAIESPKLARELRRYGAEVRAYMTKASAQFITPLTMEWATKSSVVHELSGSAEHITKVDAVVIAPASFDFISRLSLGLADSAAATFVQSQLERIPVLVAPSMHLSLQENSIFKRNLENLKALNNVEVLEPLREEGKAKMKDVESMAAQIVHKLAAGPLVGKRVLISVGPTRAYCDDMRFLSNRSTGALGLEIARELYLAGAKVCLVAGPLQNEIPPFYEITSVETNGEMKQVLQDLANKNPPDVYIFSAAVLDFEVKNPAQGKMTSRESWSLELLPSAKLLSSIPIGGALRVGFKLESRVEVEVLKSRTQAWAQENSCDFVVANRLEDVGLAAHRAFLFDRKQNTFCETLTKKEAAQKLIQLLFDKFQ